jgi:death-on-curing protein
MIEIKDVLFVHEKLIEKYGGSFGVRDITLLESALYRPFSTYDKKELYATPILKATALLESLVCNHPFVDGNKRTGYFLFRAFLLEYDYDINLSQSEKYTFVIDISSGKLRGSDLVVYVEKIIIQK